MADSDAPASSSGLRSDDLINGVRSIAWLLDGPRTSQRKLSPPGEYGHVAGTRLFWNSLGRSRIRGVTGAGATPKYFAHHPLLGDQVTMKLTTLPHLPKPESQQ